MMKKLTKVSILSLAVVMLLSASLSAAAFFIVLLLRACKAADGGKSDDGKVKANGHAERGSACTDVDCR